jgi:endonuclease/exonuclease/phosphatase family metal-dependent hydrolase
MQIRVATYNIHKGVMGLRKHSRIHDLRLALHSIDADIVFLQEVQERNERLARRAGHHNGTQLDVLCTGGYLHRVYGKNAVYPHGHHGNAIVSRHEIGQHLNHDISDHALEKRGLLHAISHIGLPRGSALDIHLINTHFGLIKRSRVRQAEFLIDFVRNEVPEDAPLIIAGDFNDWQQGVDEVLHRDLDVVEAAGEFNRRQHRRRTLDRLLPWRSGAKPLVARTYPSVMPWLTLDRIYVRGFKVRDVKVPRGVEWSQRSDHMPLIADLEVT